MTVALEDDGASYRPCADDMSALPDDYDPTDAPVTTAASSVSRVPLHGPVDTHDVMCAKVIFALCGSVFPHPLLLAQQLLGIEDQDFAEFQLNVAEAGNNCIDIVAAYLTNLRTLQSEEEPNPPVSLAMIQPRHAATVASVAAKARDLLSELALARATVKPRKAPKNKAIDAAARAAAASASPAPAPGSGTSSSSVLSGPSANGDATTSDESDMPSDTGPAGSGEDGLGSDSNDEGSCCGADTSRDDSAAPRTAREDEERLLFALQGAGAEETLKMARALPPGCKRSEPRPSSEGQPASVPASASSTCPGGVTPSGPASASPRAPPPPPPPPARTTSAMAQYAAGQAGPYGNGNNGNGRNGQEHGRNGGAQGRQAQALGQGQALGASSLQTALSCPVTGLPEVGAGTASPPTSGPLHGPGYSGNGSGNGGSQTGMHPAPPPSHGQSGRRGGRDGGGNNQGQHGNGGRRNATATGHGGQHTSRSSPTPPPPPPVGISAAQLQQQAQHAQQQHQLAMAHLLGLSRTTQPYGNSGGPFGGNANAAAAAAYGNQLAALQGAFAGVAAASGGLSTCYGNNPAGGAASRLDAALGGYNSMAAATAALELAAAQQALNSGFGSFGPAGGGGGGGFGAGPAGALSGLGGLAGGLSSAASGFGMGVGMGPRSGISLADQQAAAHAAALLQQGGPGLSMLPDGMKGSGAADAWSNVLLQAQLAGSLA